MAKNNTSTVTTDYSPLSAFRFGWHDVRHQWVKHADFQVIGVFRGVGMFNAARFALGGTLECPESKEQVGRKFREMCCFRNCKRIP